MNNIWGDKINLKKMNIHEIKGSFFVYIPKIWVKQKNLKKGDKVVWSIEEGDHNTLHLRKVNGYKSCLKS